MGAEIGSKKQSTISDIGSYTAEAFTYHSHTLPDNPCRKRVVPRIEITQRMHARKNACSVFPFLMHRIFHQASLILPKCMTLSNSLFLAVCTPERVDT